MLEIPQHLAETRQGTESCRALRGVGVEPLRSEEMEQAVEVVDQIDRARAPRVPAAPVEQVLPQALDGRPTTEQPLEARHDVVEVCLAELAEALVAPISVHEPPEDLAEQRGLRLQEEPRASPPQENGTPRSRNASISGGAEVRTDRNSTATSPYANPWSRSRRMVSARRSASAVSVSACQQTTLGSAAGRVGCIDLSRRSGMVSANAAAAWMMPGRERRLSASVNHTLSGRRPWNPTMFRTSAPRHW